jgi:hypothetical protein
VGNTGYCKEAQEKNRQKGSARMTSAAIRQQPSNRSNPERASKVLYLGPAPDELCEVLAAQIGRIDITYHADVQSAITEARSRQYDVILVDQRDSHLASQLILPLVSALGYPVKLVVISAFADVGHYLSVPGVARVLAAPLREVQLLRVLGLERRKPRGETAEKPPEKTPAPKQKGLVGSLIDRFMGLVSNTYKRAAFVLLFVLFSTFSFYGVLIGYFLLSSSWGAPMTLTRGHELVSKAERDLTEMRVALNQSEQRLTDSRLAEATAENALKDAGAQIKTAIGTIRREIKVREKQITISKRTIGRLGKVRRDIEKQLNSGAVRSNLNELYSKRLISRKDFTSSSLGILEATQRLTSIENEIDAMQITLEETQGTIELLKMLSESLLSGDAIISLSAAPPELLLVVKQSVEARAAEQLAKTQIISAQESQEQLLANRTVLSKQIAAVELSAVGRAIHTRIDVVFVPYTNAKNFSPGEKLYSCAFTILWCKDAGQIGEPLPGEFNTVHPFFGKPIRGTFVEAITVSPEAAKREIIHGTRAPFFF